MKEKKKAVAILVPRYQKASKKKGRILDEFIALTGYCRTHASYVLSMHGRRKMISKKTVIQADVRKTGCRGRRKNFGDVLN